MEKREINALQREIVDSIDNDVSGRLLLSPRLGKTKIIIDIIKRDKPDTILWVTPSVQLAEVDIPQEFVTWKAKRYLPKLKTVTWSSLHKETGEYDLIILDEEQKITENNSVTLLDNTLRGRILSMTGTPTKSSEKKDIYDALDLKILFDISINEAVDFNLLADYEIKVLEFDYDKKNGYLNKLLKNVMPIGKYVLENNKINFKEGVEGSLSINKGTSSRGVELYFIKDKLFSIKGYLLLDNSYGKLEMNGNKFMLKNGDIYKDINILPIFTEVKKYNQKHKIAKQLLNSLQGRVLIFCGSIKQAEDICEHTYHSKTDSKDLHKFVKGEIDTIAMVNSGGIGFTYKNIDHLILVQADSDRNGNTSQRIARTLLKQGDYKAKIWILCMKNTPDEKWVNKALENFDNNKIKRIKV